MTRTFTKNIIILASIGLLILMGCSATTLQSPKVLQSRRKAIGVGIAGVVGPIPGNGEVPFKPGTGPIETSLYTRIGLSNNFDIGIKIFLPPLGVLGDVKYQILQKPFLLSVDFGLSYSWYPGHQFVALYPMLLFGGKDYYGGIKVIHTEGTTIPGIMMGGGLIRDRFRIMPEVNIYGLSRQDIFMVGALGIQYSF